MHKLYQDITPDPVRMNETLHQMARMTPEEVAAYVTYVEYERAKLRNQVDWLDGLAMLLRGEPDRYDTDDDGNELDEPMDEQELYERYDEKEKRLTEMFYPAKLQKS